MILKFSLLPVTVQHDWFGFSSALVRYPQVGLTAWLCWLFPPWGRASGCESLLHLFAMKSSGVYQQAVSQHRLCLRSDIQATFVKSVFCGSLGNFLHHLSNQRNCLPGLHLPARSPPIAPLADPAPSESNHYNINFIPACWITF